MRGYPGCHGFHVTPTDIGAQLGRSGVKPPLSCTVTVVQDLPRKGSEIVWRSDWPGEGDRPAMWEEVWLDHDHSLLFLTGHRPSVRIRADQVQIARDATGTMMHALASTALPALAQLSNRLVLHAAAAADESGITVICGQSGAGKSSLLIALAAKGWQTFSDDLCIVHPTEETFTLWPGPQWIRLGALSTHPLALKFEMEWKNAFSDDAWHAHAPARIKRLIFLDRPGGDQPEWRPVAREDAVPLISENALWLLQPQDRGRRLFPSAVALASAAPSFQLRVPYSDNWLDLAVEVLTQP